MQMVTSYTVVKKMDPCNMLPNFKRLFNTFWQAERIFNSQLTWQTNVYKNQLDVPSRMHPYCMHEVDVQHVRDGYINSIE